MATILITGSSSGIGMATALELGRAGHQVLATMRNPARAPELRKIVEAEDLPVSISPMDVTSDSSVDACFREIQRAGLEVDVLVNNAGIERHGSTEELPLDDFREVMETNYFGAIRCIKKVVPGMRRRGEGCIINVTSVSGKIAASPLGGYAASKHALEAVSEALAQEMKPFGVRVHIVEPGIIDTPMAHAIENPPSSVYRQGANLSALFRASLKNPTPPSVVARVIKEVVEGGTWKLRHAAGPDAAPFLAWRAGLSDEEWIKFNSLDSDEYRECVRQTFGMELDLDQGRMELRTAAD